MPVRFDGGAITMIKFILLVKVDSPGVSLVLDR